MLVDLHIHTIFSDGMYSPEEVVTLASRANISIISITDHDTVEGIEPVLEAAKNLGLTVIPGVELSARKENKSVHILGYFIDYKNAGLVDFLKWMKKARYERAEKVLEKLKSFGIKLNMQEVVEEAGLGVIGRPHIAEVLVKRGSVNGIGEAFAKYLGYGKPCYVPKANVNPKEAIDVIKDATGIPILAHPGLLSQDDWIPELVEDGLEGIEVWYSRHSKNQIKKYKRIAQTHNLLMSGGSDSHGRMKKYPLIGEYKLPYSFLKDLLTKVEVT
jgi:predicted metal-dependent phosphoesterase TrpH